MPEPLKNLYSHDLIRQMAGHLQRAHPPFDATGFARQAGRDLDQLELKERARQICDALNDHLPSDFAEAIEVMLAGLHPEDDVALNALSMDERGIRGWAVMPMSELVGLRCSEGFDLALEAQRQMTGRFSSEFGIRYSILEDAERAMAAISGWTTDRNYHVRRLATEGIRPRLPWAMQLPMFIADPTPILPVLEALKDDESEYVRRSVANNLNDISKDHPDLAAQIAADWMKDADRQRERLVRHACRSLVKAGHAGALEALGYGPAEVDVLPIRLTSPRVDFGKVLEFEVSLVSTGSKPQQLVVDYALHLRKANGRTAPKVFKLKTFTLEPGERITLARRHAIRPITTRRYYGGEQAVEIQVNGQGFGTTAFELVMPENTPV